MIFHKSEGIVIGSINYSGTSKIVKIFTRDFGKISLVARGARRKKSEFKGALETLNLIEIVFIPGKGELQTLVECYLLDDFHDLKACLSCVKTAYEIVSMTDEMQPAGDANPKIYRLVVEALRSETSPSQRSNHQTRTPVSPWTTAFCFAVTPTVVP